MSSSIPGAKYTFRDMDVHIDGTNVHGIPDTSQLATLNTAQVFTGQKTFAETGGGTGVVLDCTGGSGHALKLKMNAPPNGNWTYDMVITAVGAIYTGAWMVISGTLDVSATDGVFMPSPPTADPFMLGVRGDVDGPCVQIRPQATSNARALDVINDTGVLYAFSIGQDGKLKWGNANTYAGMDANTNLYRAGSNVLKTDATFQVGGRLDAQGNISTQTLVDGNLVVRLDLTTGSGYTEFKNFGVTVDKAFVQSRQAVTYSASMTPDASTGSVFVITATNGTAFTINAPTNPVSGQQIGIMIRNTSGGALGTATWNAVFKMTAWTQPANGNSRSIDFVYDGTNWVETGRTAADVPN